MIVDPIEALGWAASAATVIAYAMKTMMPLRVAAIVANTLFLIYAALTQIWPLLVVEAVLLPFNSWRLWQILALRRRLAAMRGAGMTDFSAVKAYSRALTLRAGDHVFRRGDTPDALYYLDAGEVELEEIGVRLGAGDIFGEIAFFTDAKARTASALCTSDCRVHALDEAAFLRLYFQDPVFGMSVMKLVTRRLVDGMGRAPNVYRGGNS